MHWYAPFSMARMTTSSRYVLVRISRYDIQICRNVNSNVHTK